MPITVQCSACQKRLRVKDELVGKKIKCSCGATFLAVDPDAAPAQPDPKPAAQETAPRPGGKRRARQRKQLLIAGCILLLIFGGLLGYAWMGEADMRKRVRAPEGVDFGFIPLDLLQGRTKFEKRRDGEVVFSLNSGPQGETRGTLAQVGFGIGVLGVALLGLRAFLKDRPRLIDSE